MEDFYQTFFYAFTCTNDLHKLPDAQFILMYHSVVKVKKIASLSFSKLSFKCICLKLRQ